MRYYALTLDEVLQVLAKWNKRTITAVHLHHTIAPSRNSFAEIADLERLAAQSDSKTLPQHLTIDATGLVWTGRHWDLPPASIPDENGDSTSGPFAITLVGDFTGEPFDGPQRTTAIGVVAGLLRKFNLSQDKIVLHRDLDAASNCPGGRFDAATFRTDVWRALDRTPVASRPGAAAPFSDEHSTVTAFLDALASAPATLNESPAAQPRESLVRGAIALSQGASSRDLPTPPPRRTFDEFAANELRPHVVNMTQGLLSTTGRFKTRESDIVEMFNVSIPAYIAKCRASGRTPRIVVFAHGGLNDEKSGLEGALNQLEWWDRNHVYPIFFVWETGLLQSIRFLLRPAPETRNFFSDRFSDPLIEKTVHLIGGVQIWGNMKQSAERASAHERGGARLIAQRLGALMKSDPNLEVHGVGHSAGAILHAHFLPLVTSLAARDISSLQLLAPAIRTDEFKSRLLPRVGNGQGIGSLSMYTMRADLEEDDTCATVYRKSLLCLIRAGLEPARNTPILGLEDSLDEDATLLSFFGMDGQAGKANVVFSRSPAGAPPDRRSTSKTHGGFDNNIETMDSVARRVLGPADSAANFVSFAHSSAASTRALELEDPLLTLPEDVRDFLRGTPPRLSIASVAEPPRPQPQTQPAVIVQPGGINRKRALCVGINDYGSQSLQFCVADAELWVRSLEQQGFSCSTLFDRQATRDGILARLRELVRESVPGDLLVLQFAGHGTLVPDLDGDEMKSGEDFAYVPFDFESGAFVLDDDIFAIWRELKEGVTAASFFDACHSGRGLRMFSRGEERTSMARRARFLTLTPAQKQKYIDDRSARGARAHAAESGEIRGSAVFFSACAEKEVALERDGHGDFSRIAAPEVANASRLTNRGFHERVLAAFGAVPSQTPQFDAAPDGRRSDIAEQPFLQPITPRLQIAAAGGRALSMTRLEWRRDDAPRLQPRI
jgi:hypothetical protein